MLRRMRASGHLGGTPHLVLDVRVAVPSGLGGHACGTIDHIWQAKYDKAGNQMAFAMIGARPRCKRKAGTEKKWIHEDC